MLLGRLDEALHDLNRAIGPGYQDAEALIWRAEVNRHLGKNEEALKDLKQALPIEMEENHEWIYFNRALAKAALGDMTGMQEDFERIPVEIVEYIKRKLGWTQRMPRTYEDVRRILNTGLNLARGIRRSEPYIRAVWMGPTAKNLD